MRQKMNVRKEALRLLRTAEQKDAYLSRLLDGALQSSPLSERDRALLAALVFGVTEKRVTLDYCIDALCSTHEPPGARMRMILRLGAYQLLFLTAFRRMRPSPRRLPSVKVRASAPF